MIASYVCVTAPGDRALTIIDVTNPATPTFKGSIQGEDNYLKGASGVHVVGNYAYVAAQSSRALTIIDISDPANPLFKGSIQGEFADHWLDGANHVQVVGDYAYVAVMLGHALTIIDVSDPANPTAKGNIWGAENHLNAAVHVHVVGDYAYVAVEADNALTIIDISDPENPTFKGVIHSTGAAYLDWARCVHVIGNYAYVAARADNALTIIDVTNPATPTFKGSIRGSGTPNYLNGAFDIYVVGNYAYVAAWTEDALTIIDISDPALPTFKGSIQNGGWPLYLDGARAVKVVGNYAYVAAFDDDSLTIIDVSDPATPIYKGHIRGSYNYLKGALDVDFFQRDHPVVTTEPVTDIVGTTATGNGTVTDLGSPNPTQHGHCWSTSPNPTIADDKTELGPKTTIGAFTSSLTGLTIGTPNYCRGYAISDAGTVYGNEVEFTPLARNSIVITDPATSLEKTAATLNGTLDDDGDEACACGFEYGETTDYGTTTPTESKETGETFSQALSGLTPGKHYHFRAIATNSAGTSYGSDRSFFAKLKGGNPHIDQLIYQHVERMDR